MASYAISTFENFSKFSINSFFNFVIFLGKNKPPSSASPFLTASSKFTNFELDFKLL